VQAPHEHPDRRATRSTGGRPPRRRRIAEALQAGEPERPAGLGPFMERASEAVMRWTGSTGAFLLAVAVILAWIVTGPVFHYSDTWQLVINTATTIVTFLMVFLIQRAQNKDSRAVAIKLNELIAALEGASNRLIDVESMSERDLEVLHEHFKHLVEMAGADRTLRESHSIEEAEGRHARKAGARPKPAPRRA
jgi:low affinity Fe/Cu permease